MRSHPGAALGGKGDAGATCFQTRTLRRPRALAGVASPPRRAVCRRRRFPSVRAALGGFPVARATS
jgi:hypothetical protein